MKLSPFKLQLIARDSESADRRDTVAAHRQGCSNSTEVMLVKSID